MRQSMLLFVFISAFTAGSCLAQRGFNREPDYYPLGGIEAQGIVSGHDEDSGIEVKEVFPEGLAKKGGLQINDIIIKAGGKKLTGKTDDAIINKLCALIEKAEAKKTKEAFGKIILVVKRQGKKTKVEVPVRPYAKPAKSNPHKCAKTAKIISEGLDFLSARQKETGQQQHVSNQNHAVATASLCGLAWLGSGQEKYNENVARAAQFVMENAGIEREKGMISAAGGKSNWNQTNWSLSYAAIFLAEYCAQKQIPLAQQKLTEIVLKLEENQETSGGWAHGPGGPNALNYLELEIMSNLALGGMGMAHRLGIQLNNAKLVKGFQYVKACTSGGGVAYSPRPGQKGAGDPGRTAGAHWALSQIGKGKELQSSMVKYYSRQLGTLYEGHASPTMHVLNGALSSAIQGKKAYGKYWKTWRPFIMASRTKDGAFGCRPTHESRQMKHHADRTWGPSFVTAHYMLALELAQGRFKLLDTKYNRQ